MRRTWKLGLVLVCLVALTWLMVETQTGATAVKTVKKNGTVKGLVTDSHNRPLEGATVYFIESSLIDLTPIKQADVLGTSAVGTDPNATDNFDEPLEDIVFGRNPKVDPKTLPQGKTDAKGKFSAKGLDPYARYFAFTNPSEKDVDHIPGGDQSRVSFQLKSPKPVKTAKVSARGLDKGQLHIKMSWKVPADATYIGTSACYVCHGDGATISQTTCKQTAHALMFRRMGSDTANQNAAAHKGSNWLELDSKFIVSSAYNKPVSGTAMTTLWLQDNNDSTNTFVIYETNTTTATAPATTPVIFKVYLWKTTAGVYKVTFENVFNSKDPLNLTTLDVNMTMGGYIRQRLLVKVPGLKATYTLFQYQSLTGSASQGLQTSYDRNRKPWAVGGAGGGGFTNFYTLTKKDPATVSTAVLKLPTKATSNVNSCAVCHYGAGNTTKFVDSTTGETLAHTVDDPNGVFDLGGDGRLQDVGVSCEQCHGPGSKHREEALKTVQVVGAQKGGLTDTTGKYIVQPEFLGADRASLICGRCHDANALKEEVSEFPPPGISRTEFIAEYITRRGTAQSGIFQDGVHGRGGHHGFTYSNFLLSKHYRNATQMLACDTCHAAMGDSNFRYSLRDDPDDSSLGKGLCNGCHAVDIAAHSNDKTGDPMNGSSLNCTNCHMTRTGRTGAGRPGLIVGAPTGAQTDANIVYWQGDQSSHVFDVIKKFDIGVTGVTPGNAMPSPYTNSCGTCHDASKLQFQAPK